MFDQLIGVRQTELRGTFCGSVGDIFHPDCAVIMDFRVFCDQFARHQCYVIGAGHMSVGI